MATAAYNAWNAAGRPLTPSRTIREHIEKMRAAYPGAPFSWHADDAHYQASNPLDHTPFSTDEWPVDCPRYVVFATDIMPHPTYNVDELAAYWIAEARAGRTPWRKYIIYRDKSYSVRSGWVEKDYGGDYHDHVHLSDRTDYETASIGVWNPVPPEETNMLIAQIRGNATCHISDGIHFRPIKSLATLRRYKAAGVKHHVVDTEADLLDLCGERNWDGPDPVTLTPEQLAEVMAAADAGARQGSGGASVEEVRDAVADGFEGGATKVREG